MNKGQYKRAVYREIAKYKMNSRVRKNICVQASEVIDELKTFEDVESFVIELLSLNGIEPNKKKIIDKNRVILGIVVLVLAISLIFINLSFKLVLGVIFGYLFLVQDSKFNARSLILLFLSAYFIFEPIFSSMFYNREFFLVMLLVILGISLIYRGTREKKEEKQMHFHTHRDNKFYGKNQL